MRAFVLDILRMLDLYTEGVIMLSKADNLTIDSRKSTDYNFVCHAGFH